MYISNIFGKTLAKIKWDCYSSPPVKKHSKNADGAAGKKKQKARSLRVRCEVRAGEIEGVAVSKLNTEFSERKENKVVDGKRKMPHNLVSLLLTNKTI